MAKIKELRKWLEDNPESELFEEKARELRNIENTVTCKVDRKRRFALSQHNKKVMKEQKVITYHK